MYFKGLLRSHDCEGENSGAGGLRAASEAAPSRAPVQFLACRHSHSSTPHDLGFTILLGEGNINERFILDLLKEWQFWEAGVGRYLDLNQECQSVLGPKHD